MKFNSLDELQQYMAEHEITKTTVVQTEDGFESDVE